ncbi:RHS repeat-associated core domain-containing protein [Dyella psychrodurans]|nr:RHS repeat-associated core domain-containing protein [Dyella psychrodurans]
MRHAKTTHHATRPIWRTIWLLTCLLLCGAAHADKVTYILTDPNGTVLAEADAQGNITKTFDYRPYGEQALGQPPNGPGYTGHVNDPDTDLVYMQARYYDPETGRFLSVDPAGPAPGDVFGFNRYAYAHNNPITNVDPNGRESASLTLQGVTALQADIAQTTPAQASQALMAMSLIPGIGDIPNIAQAVHDPSFPNIAVATIGVVGSEVSGPVAGVFKEVAEVKTANQLGKEGEAAVRAVYDIGDKKSIMVNGRTRVPDGVKPGESLSEVKNVGKLSLTGQLRDYRDFSQSEGSRFNLYTRPDTQFSGPLQDQFDQGLINRMDIPPAQ